LKVFLTPSIAGFLWHKTILETQEVEFQDWGAFLEKWYKPVPSGWIQVNHNFLVERDAPTVLKFSAAVGAEVREFDFKKNGSGTQEHRVAEMKAAACTVLPFPGIRDIKQAELYKKWRQYIPKMFKDKACLIVSFWRDSGLKRMSEQGRKECLQMKGKRLRKEGLTG
jgi:hypothetical protein